MKEETALHILLVCFEVQIVSSIGTSGPDFQINFKDLTLLSFLKKYLNE